MPHCFSALAEVLWKLGDPKDALAAVDRGLHCGEVSGQHYEDSELLRLRGEIMATREEKPDDGAGAAFEAALELTRRQQARSLELRAAMSLARLWQRQGRTEAARELLLPVHEWFSEGFETQDWKRAEVLLAELR